MIKIDKNTGLLDGVAFVPSPNHDERPDESDICLLVIHGISLPPGEFGGKWIDDLFTNQLDPDAHPYFQNIHQLEVSSHLLIRRTGDIIQYVPLQKRAWHAGVSRFEGRERCNDFAIGIELEGTDDTPYEAIQYQRLAEVSHEIMLQYPAIDKEHIVGHSDIAPGRK
ncbi:MAG: 1,6-anhydro-N-acetylmuramyl-L-alanine amidase AmpD, partial [Gammaproteobacteria bacterium]|nr:1,6-anhydro-N-acetylmuramyl-L-alanine amidase AmpD [Gammaproteobacteria bacterium]